MMWKLLFVIAFISTASAAAVVDAADSRGLFDIFSQTTAPPPVCPAKVAAILSQSKATYLAKVAPLVNALPAFTAAQATDPVKALAGVLFIASSFSSTIPLSMDSCTRIVLNYKTFLPAAAVAYYGIDITPGMTHLAAVMDAYTDVATNNYPKSVACFNSNIAKVKPIITQLGTGAVTDAAAGIAGILLTCNLGNEQQIWNPMFNSCMAI